MYSGEYYNQDVTRMFDN